MLLLFNHPLKFGKNLVLLLFILLFLFIVVVVHVAAIVHVVVDPRNLHLKFGQNWVINK